MFVIQRYIYNDLEANPSNGDWNVNSFCFIFAIHKSGNRIFIMVKSRLS